MSKLVIVESPTKARTIGGFLPAGYRVEASMGHVRDLPASASEIPAKVKDEEWSRLGVNIEAGFEPLYVIPKDKKKVVKELAQALSDADELLLATDEDREGESIAWHLTQVLKPKIPVRRMVFHEITREAIEEALVNWRAIDDKLVSAQETRRILDRLVGYTVSPLLWKKIKPKLSAGRVQSAAVRLLVLREQERRTFASGEYWDLRATLAKQRERFTAQLAAVGGVRVATGKDFDETTGKLIPGREVVLLNEQQAKALAARLEQASWKVSDVTERDQVRTPAPPFTTSTLQQEANRKLGFAARQTMQVAQKLYENGFITYMRTDSVHLAEGALTTIRERVKDKYGPDYLSPAPRQYTTTSKGAQEAHEAIRPAGHEMPTADELGLSGAEYQIYDLIWKRTIATQMADAQLRLSTVTIVVDDAEFRASGKRIVFPGFFRAYVEGADDPDAALDDQETLLPPLAVGDPLTCVALEPAKHETAPPARYNDATLVRALESEGIGRPSTYATIISTIQDRGYVMKSGKQLIPTFTAFAVNQLLEQHFPDLVDMEFTAQMERVLDEIAEGRQQSQPYLQSFYLGNDGLDRQVKSKSEAIDPRDLHALTLDKIGAKVRVGRFGAYLEQNGGDSEPLRVSLPDTMPPADLRDDEALRLLHEKVHGPTAIGYHPQTREPIYVLIGPYGPYVQLGGNGSNGVNGETTNSEKKPRRVSLPKGLQPEDLTLAQALGLLELPRKLGKHPTTGQMVDAGIGRFGPYVRHDGSYRSLPKTDDVLTISLERAIELLAQEKKSRRKSTSLRELGVHPENGEPIAVFDGRYGPYVKSGKTNASLPKEMAVDTLTLDQALDLLNKKAGQSSKKSVPSRKKTGQTSKKTAQADTQTGKTSRKAGQKSSAKTKGRNKAKPD